ncbi:hypothetical protein AVEN_133172-1 [Araneus ventricosus]|uniref:Uncharacterized protein n=1 Tax=Araneus ventricosus TaxID=182803 RepID=A0A4Y2UIL0_ARAVE|nr:hypothetical protein AVEN_133172-1 [Araneus ventricosus]
MMRLLRIENSGSVADAILSLLRATHVTAPQIDVRPVIGDGFKRANILHYREARTCLLIRHLLIPTSECPQGYASRDPRSVSAAASHPTSQVPPGIDQQRKGPRCVSSDSLIPSEVPQDMPVRKRPEGVFPAAASHPHIWVHPGASEKETRCLFYGNFSFHI